MAMCCAACGKEMKPSTVSTCEASFGTCSIELYDFPVLTCGNASHPRRQIGPEFGTDFIGALFFGKAPISRPKIWQGPVCVGCGGALPEASTVPSTELSFAVRVKDYPPFGMKLRSRGTSCGRCGLKQAVVDRELDESLPEAILLAFAYMGLSP